MLLLKVLLFWLFLLSLWIEGVSASDDIVEWALVDCSSKPQGFCDKSLKVRFHEVSASNTLEGHRGCNIHTVTTQCNNGYEYIFSVQSKNALSGFLKSINSAWFRLGGSFTENGWFVDYISSQMTKKQQKDSYKNLKNV